MLAQITNLTNDLKTSDESLEDQDEGVGLDKPTHQGPVLLLGSFPHAPFSELLGYLPQRAITDRLIARFFQGKEPAWSMPTGVVVTVPMADLE